MSYSFVKSIHKDSTSTKLSDWEEVVERSATEENFIIVISYDKWARIMGSRKEMPKQMQKPQLIRGYFELFKEQIIKYSEAKGKVLVGFEPDPMATFMREIRTGYDNDPNNVPAKIAESGFPEALELNPPQNFAGFWQVIDYMREKYAPNVMLAPTIKTWGIPVNAGNEPEGGWEGTEGVQIVVDYYEKYNVNWNALAFNFNSGTPHDDETFKKIARYVATIAKAMKNNTGKRVRPYIWKTKIVEEHYDGTPAANWEYNDVSFIHRNIEYLASIGYTGANVGYGSQLFLHEYFPPLIKCWLEEYFHGEEGSCEPHGAIGLVPVKEKLD